MNEGGQIVEIKVGFKYRDKEGPGDMTRFTMGISDGEKRQNHLLLRVLGGDDSKRIVD